MSDLIYVRVDSLLGRALDWAVAKVDGVSTTMLPIRDGKKPFALFGSLALPLGDADNGYSPSSCWHCGGPVIQSHQINLEWDGVDGEAYWWKGYHQDIVAPQIGLTPLVAACRALVCAKLGETVQVPEELME